MKKSKKILALVLALVMLMSTVSVSAFAKDGSANLSATVSAKEVNIGDTISISVSNAAMTVASFAGQVKFDKEYFECVSIEGLLDEEEPGTLYIQQTDKRWPTEITTVATVANANANGIAGFAYPSTDDVTYNAGGIYKVTLKALKEGTTDVKVVEDSSGTDGYKGVVNTTAVTVKAPTVPVTGISLNKNTLSLTAGDSGTLTATVEPSNATDKTVTWSSDKTSVATVNQTGTVTAVAAGTATITATTSNGKTATCTVTVGCAHDSKTNYDEETSTCTKEGHDAYSKCDSCGQLFNASDVAIDKIPTKALADHNYTEKVDAKYLKTAGNCANKAVYYKSCSECGAKGTETFGGDTDPSKHTHLTSHVATAATCTAAGNIFYYSCDDCNKLFKQDMTEITANKTVINALGHNPVKVDAKDATCTTDGYSEHYKCSRCNALFSDAEGNNSIDSVPTTPALNHNMKKTDAKAATCTEAGNNEYYTCSNCHKVFKDAAGNAETSVEAETIKALGHKMTKTAAKAATCTEAGNNEYWTCDTCNNVFQDEAGTKPTTVAAETINALGHGDMIHHEKVDATCQKTGVKEHYECGRCHSLFMDEAATTAANDLVIAKIAHDYKGIYNETHHWTFCANCGATTDKAVHDYFTVDETTGKKTCSCGYVVYGEGTVSCGQHETKLAFDETHHWHVCQNCSYAEAKETHGFGDWEIDVEATTTETGLRHRTCKECGYVQQEVIAKKTTTPARPNHRPSGGSSATSSDKVQSSKTFDAGIAAYVGLSVLSLTGSALVIGKKKEF